MRQSRVVIAFSLYVAVMGALAACRWHAWSYGADTGTFTQSAASAFAGLRNTSELGSHLHVHWSPILVALYPFVALTHSGLSIQIVQVLLIGAGAFPFFAFVRRYVDDRLAATLAIVALIYPPLLAVAFDEFHEIAFFPALVFALLWAIDAGRWALAALFGTLLLFVREEALLVIAGFGALLALAALRSPGPQARGLLYFEPRSPRPAFVLGASLALAGPLVFAFYFGVVAPSLGGWTASHYYNYPFADGPFALLAACFTRPFDVVRAIATPERATYLLEAFGPVLFLALRSPWTIVAAPGLALCLLSSEPIAWRMGSHYPGLWAPWLLVATADRVVRSARARPSLQPARRLLAGIVACCALVLAVFNPAHPFHYLTPPYGDLAAAQEAFAAVPAGAGVFTHDEWFSEMSGRRPGAQHVWNEPEYAVLARDFPNAQRFEPFIDLEVSRGCYAVERSVRNVVIYRRTAIATSFAQCRIVR